MSESNQQSAQNSQRLLRLALRGNAAFSTVCGIILIAFGDSLGTLIGSGPLGPLGWSLLPFAGLVAWISMGKPIRKWPAIVVVALDALWVAGSIPLLFPSSPLTGTGKILALLAADAVLVFAVLQAMGIYRSRRSSRA